MQYLPSLQPSCVLSLGQHSLIVLALRSCQGCSLPTSSTAPFWSCRSLQPLTLAELQLLACSKPTTTMICTAVSQLSHHRSGQEQAGMPVVVSSRLPIYASFCQIQTLHVRRLTRPPPCNTATSCPMLVSTTKLRAAAFVLQEVSLAHSKGPGCSAPNQGSCLCSRSGGQIVWAKGQHLVRAGQTRSSTFCAQQCRWDIPAGLLWGYIPSGAWPASHAGAHGTTNTIDM